MPSGMLSDMAESEVRPQTRREEYTEATRQALLAAARELFAREGYQATGVEAISRAARVTRGAFYHHFVDKQSLFDATVVGLQSEAAGKVERAARAVPDIWDRLRVGIDAYLDVCLEPTYARIVVQEAPTVLGETRFREIEEAYPMALLTATLRALKRQGQIASDDVDFLARMIDAMICKTALILLKSDRPRKVRKQAQLLIGNLLATLRPG